MRLDTTYRRPHVQPEVEFALLVKTLRDEALSMGLSLADASDWAKTEAPKRMTP